MLNEDSQKIATKTLAVAQLEELRQMLTGLNRKELQHLNSLLKDPEAFAEEIRKLLPLSIKKMVDAGDLSMESLMPLLEEGLRQSIENHPEKLADILFPIMMPAIRKAVAADIRQMLDSLNKTLEYGFSLKRLVWRFQALFSGRKYSEIVLSHAYIYQVKQVFLIHKTTGLLLAQVSDDTEGHAADADMVSSMLSAIKDFVQDSFTDKKGNTLEEINVGRLRILLEQGPYAIIAAVVEGNVPRAYHDLLKETIEGVHVSFYRELENFSGDVSPFEKDKALLKPCLQKEQKPVKKKKPVFAIFLLLLVAAFLVYGIYYSIDKHLRYKQLLGDLQHTPGIVITRSHSGVFGKTWFRGLRDPRAVNPVSLLKKEKFRPEEVDFSFKPYLSTAPPLVLQRARRLLKPPASVTMNFKDGTLLVSGKADSSWLKTLYDKYPMVFGVEKLKVTVATPKIRAKEKEKVSRNILAIQKHVFHFKYNVFSLDSAQVREFNKLIDEVKNVLNFSFRQDSVPVIVVNAYTSYAGNTEANKIIAQHRAEQFINLMIRNGIPQEVLVPKVRFVENFNHKYPIRSVSFDVKYVKPENL
jgi:outer membrane protein OmpA-like peptidoglycan-associated protein